MQAVAATCWVHQGFGHSADTVLTVKHGNEDDQWSSAQSARRFGKTTHMPCVGLGALSVIRTGDRPRVSATRTDEQKGACTNRDSLFSWQFACVWRFGRMCVMSDQVHVALWMCATRSWRFSALIASGTIGQQPRFERVQRFGLA